MTAFDREQLARLIDHHDEPCVSLCMPTHRRLPEASQDPVRFANLVREVAHALEKKYGKRHEASAEILKELRRFADEGPDGHGSNDFWAHQKDGLALFVAPGFSAWYSTHIPLRDITVVADSFHVKPLLPLLRSNLHCHVLCLTKNEVRLYEGDEDSMSEVKLRGVPTSAAEVLGDEIDLSAGVTARRGGTGGSVHHGSGGHGADDDKEALRRYFRAVDKAILENHSGASDRPLILVAVDYYHPLFREISKNPHLVGGGIMQDPKSLSNERLCKEVGALFKVIRQGRLDDMIETFGTAKAWAKGSSELTAIGEAAAVGRVKCLLVEEKRRVWGRVDRETGALTLGGEEGNPDDADILDDLAELTLAQGGDVMLVPRDRMPSDSGLAALYRF